MGLEISTECCNLGRQTTGRQQARERHDFLANDDFQGKGDQRVCLSRFEHRLRPRRGPEKKKGKKKIEALAVRTGMDDPEKRSEDMLMGGAVSCRHGREHSEIAGSGGVGVRVASLRSNALWTTKHRRA